MAISGPRSHHAIQPWLVLLLVTKFFQAAGFSESSQQNVAQRMDQFVTTAG